MQRSHTIFDSIKVAESNIQTIISIPPGYVEISLSTKGKLGAPESFHIRNFKVQEIYSLAMVSDSALPVKLIQVLNDMIYEDDVDVANFHEKEVEELRVYIYTSFFKDKLEDVEFPWDESDLEYLKSKPNGEELVKDIREGKWVPRTTIVLSRDLDTYEIPDDYNPDITVKNSKTGFQLTFGYVKYGDRLVVKKWLDDFFAEEDAKFKETSEKISYNAQIKEQAIDNPEMLSRLIALKPEEEQAYNDYVTRKAEYLTEVLRYISLKNYDGMDIGSMSLSDKYKLLSSDARIDYTIMRKLAKKERNVKFGLKPEVKLMNPITEKECTRRFSFRIPEILQAMLLFRDDEDDDESDA